MSTSDNLNLVQDIIQLMHSFEVNIRMCQSVNSYVHRGEAIVEIILFSVYYGHLT